MRIAFYAPLKAPTHPVPSGDRRVGRLFWQALEQAGHQPFLAATLRTWDDGTRPGRPERLAALGRRLAARLIRRWQGAPPDLWFTYHLYHKAPDWLGPVVAGHFGIPYLVAEASHAPKRATGPLAFGHAAAADAIRRAAVVLAMTSADLACLQPLVRPPARLIRFPPFIDTAPYRAAADRRDRHRAALAAATGLPTDQAWLLAVGMMRAGDKERSYQVLARALTHLADDPRWSLIIVGDGPRRPAVAAGFAALPPGRVRWLGAVAAEPLAAVYAAADLMVWPAINEAYGMALLEAQATGLPVVAGRTGGVPDLVRADRTGLLTPPGDDRAFAAAIAFLLDDPVRRAACGREAIALAAAEHDIVAAGVHLGRIIYDAASADDVWRPSADPFT